MVACYQDTPITSADLHWADLITLDLSLLQVPNGLETLAKNLEYAAHHTGFFYVENFGISDQEVRKQFEIARRFYDLPLDERMSWYDPEKYSSGQNLGYRPVTMRKPIMGVYDNLQIYSVPKFDGHHEHVHPPAFQEELRRIETFQRVRETQSWYLIQSLIEGGVQKCHRVIIQLLSILEHALELPPLTLQQKCQYEQLSQDRLHYMHYAPRTAEEHKKTAHVYSAGHTDLGLFTLLFRQPVAGLQILDAQGEWRWVQTRDNALTVNIGRSRCHQANTCLILKRKYS